MTPAIIFDFDGVIVDSLGSHLKAWVKACELIFPHNRAADENLVPEDIYRTLAGRSTNAIAMILSEYFKSPSKAIELANLKRKILTEDLSLIDLLPGVRDYLKLLEKNSIPFGVASNAPREFVQKLCQAHGLVMMHMLGIEDAPRPKPAPDLFLTCAKRLNVSPLDFNNVIVFEDSTHGIQAACDAEMIAVGVCTQHDEKTLLQSGAQITVKNLEEAYNRKIGLSLDE